VFGAGAQRHTPTQKAAYLEVFLGIIHLNGIIFKNRLPNYSNAIFEGLYAK
jgi:hypothetical protein